MFRHRIANFFKTSRINRAYGKDHHFFTSPGPGSMLSWRQKRTWGVVRDYDPTTSNYMWKRHVRHFWNEGPVFDYAVLMTILHIWIFGIGVRAWTMHPEYFRRSNLGVSIADRHHLYAYAHPYHNSRIRAIALKFKWMMIDNDWDYNDYYPLGCRPTRTPSHRRMFSMFLTSARYRIYDKYLTSTSSSNFRRMYREIGYANE